KLSNLTVEERFAFNVSLRMFTRSIVIQRRMEDLQLGVKSYQKRLNLTKTDTYRSDLKRRRSVYCLFEPKRIYLSKQGQEKQGIRMQYLPTIIWRKGDKDRATAMIQAIDKMLKTKRIMRSLERETLAEGEEGAFHLGPERPRDYPDLALKDKERYNADIRATNILIQGLPKDIHTLINHYTDVKEIWDNVKMLLEGAAGYEGTHNRVGNANPGQARQIKCYKCNGIVHIARNCTQPKRPQNLEYFKDKMLLMQAQDNGVALDEEITPTGLTEGERGFEQTKECYLTEVIPFFKTLKDHFEGIQKALTKEIKEMKEIFEEFEAEVDQNVVHRKHDEIEWKNFLIANDNLITDCLSKEVFYIATNSELNISRFTEMDDAPTVVQAHCLELEAELSKLKDKIQNDDHDELVKRFSILEESVATLREIVEEARTERLVDRSLVSACLYTKHS
nr:retrovirus-related Pol polyprotein from transposon TNT 1-94 [Tanacetum cinerariifolium]